jgi:CheY-like chemotaxis protein
VLLAEDNFLAALEIQTFLDEHGYEVAGPAPTPSAALDLLAREEVDCAILDVNLRGRDCGPIVAELRARAIPFVLVTGYADPSLDELPEDTPLLSKPVDRRALAEVLGRLCDRPEA